MISSSKAKGTRTKMHLETDAQAFRRWWMRDDVPLPKRANRHFLDHMEMAFVAGAAYVRTGANTQRGDAR